MSDVIKEAHFCKDCVYYLKSFHNEYCNAYMDDYKNAPMLDVTDKPTDCKYYLERGNHKFQFNGHYKVMIESDTWAEAEYKLSRLIDEDKVDLESIWECVLK